jgi:hypothetical protein
VVDFEAYVAGLRKPDWAKIFKTVIDDHHECLSGWRNWLWSALHTLRSTDKFGVPSQFATTSHDKATVIHHRIRRQMPNPLLHGPL